MTHDELASSLADHLRAPDRMIWCDMQLGSSGSPRPDVYLMDKSYAHPRSLAYECKVTVTDFLSDITSGKWQSYLKYANGVYFACKAGLFEKEVVPPHCGMMVYNGTRWRTAKRAVLNPVTIPQSTWLKLLIDGIEREGPRYRAHPWSEYATVEKLKKKFGDVVARVIQDHQSIERDTAYARQQAEHIVEDARKRADQIRDEATNHVGPLRAELCAVLGLDPSAQRWQLEDAIRRLRLSLTQHPDTTQLRRLTSAMQTVLDRDGWKESNG